jgi:hypothetical protein
VALSSATMMAASASTSTLASKRTTRPLVNWSSMRPEDDIGAVEGGGGIGADTIIGTNAVG